jgi:hypothetical protein
MCALRPHLVTTTCKRQTRAYIVLNLVFDLLGAGGTCIVEPWHICEHGAAVAYLREQEFDPLDLVRTRLQAVADACVDSGGSVDELVQYSGANCF